MYTLIKGTYYVVGMSPDADSIKFKADDPALWARIPTDYRAELETALAKEGGLVTIRLQAIDALETHYAPPPLRPPKDLTIDKQKTPAPSEGNHRQSRHFGEQATNTFLAFMGITDVTWRARGHAVSISQATILGRTVKEKLKDALPGYIIADDVERNGRPLGWVFAGSTPLADGAQLTKQQVGELVAASANYHLLQRGVVYPFFYMSLPSAIRTPLMQAAKQAQQNPDQEDVWVHDRTDKGVQLPSLNSLYDEAVVYPYLFRRIVRHWYSKRMARFWESLRSKQAEASNDNDFGLDLDGFFEEGDPWLFIISQQEFLHLSDILEITANSLRLRVYPYDIVFLS